MKSLNMVAIMPPDPLASKIRNLQKEFAAKFGSDAALKPPVHITFSPPTLFLDEEKFNRYQNDLSGIAGTYESFEIELQNFGFFKKNRVLFIGVSDNLHLIKMQQKFNMFLDKPDERPYHPHITIGYRNLLPDTFNNVMKEYRLRKFHATFPVDGLYLWKHENGYWKTIKYFPLLPR